MSITNKTTFLLLPDTQTHISQIRTALLYSHADEQLSEMIRYIVCVPATIRLGIYLAHTQQAVKYPYNIPEPEVSPAKASTYIRTTLICGGKKKT